MLKKLDLFPLRLITRNVYTAIKLLHEETMPTRPLAPTISTPNRMKAWIIYHHGKNEQLTFSDSIQLPVVLSPTEVVVKILASSVNPIDIRRREGYGEKLINVYQTMRRLAECGSQMSNKLNFPMILGRDFCGEIIRKGPKVTKFNVGDKVYGALNVTQQGTFAQYCAAEANQIALKPKNISDEEAAALPLVSLTSWYAIRHFSGFNERNAPGKRALILGASGGVGQIATQLCINLRMETTALCAADSFDYMRELGAQDFIDYQQKNWLDELLNRRAKYDFILDTVGPRHYSFEMMNPLLNKSGTFTTIVTPLFSSVDKYGLVKGLTRAVYSAARKTYSGLSNGTHYRWAFYQPDGRALEQIKQLVEENRLKTQLDPKKFTFEQIPDATAHLESGDAKGKIVIKYFDKQ